MAQSAGNKAAAEAIFEQGKLLMQSGDYRQACLKFEASRKLDEGVGTMLYLADCYEKTGRTASAWAMFKEAASIAGAQGQDSRQKLAIQRTRSLEPGLVKLSIDVAQGDESLLGFEVRNDGVAVPPAQFGAPVPVDPGDHRIEASAPGKRTFSQAVNITKGAVRITIPLLTDLSAPSGNPTQSESAPAAANATTIGSQPEGTPAANQPGAAVSSNGTVAPKDGSPDHGKTQRIASIALGGLGIVGIGVGTVYGFTAIHNNSQSKNECPSNPNICSDAGVNGRNDALRQARISTVAFVAGGAALAAGAVLYFTAPNGQPLPITVQASVEPRTAQLNFGGAF